MLHGTTLKLQTTVVLHGPEGTGKGLLSRILGLFYGKHLIVLEQKGLDSRFSDQLANGPLFIFANEVESSSNRTSETTNRLKAWITDLIIEFEGKYQAAKNIINQFNILFASNEDRPVVVSASDRRYTVKRQTRKLDPTIGERISDDINGPQTQVAGFLWFLLRRKCTIKVGQIYATRDKEEVRAASAPSDVKFAHEIKEDGWLSVASGWIAAGRPEEGREVQHEGFVPNEVLKQVYRHFCTLENLKARGNLGKTITEVFEIESTLKTIGSIRRRGYYLPLRGEDEPRLVEQIQSTMRPEGRRHLEPETKTDGA